MNGFPYRLSPALEFARSRLKRHRRDAVRSVTLSLRPHLPQSKLQRSNPGLPGLTRARTIGAMHLAQRRRSILPAVKPGIGCDAGMRLPLPWREGDRTLVTDDCRFSVRRRQHHAPRLCGVTGQSGSVLEYWRRGGITISLPAG